MTLITIFTSLITTSWWEFGILVHQGASGAISCKLEEIKWTSLMKIISKSIILKVTSTKKRYTWQKQIVIDASCLFALKEARSKWTISTQVLWFIITSPLTQSNSTTKLPRPSSLPHKPSSGLPAPVTTVLSHLLLNRLWPRDSIIWSFRIQRVLTNAMYWQWLLILTSNLWPAVPTM